MPGLKINAEKCVGCGICLKSCSSGALTIRGGKAVDNNSCVLCGLCVDSCPSEAISIHKESLETAELSLYKNIFVFAEQSGDELTRVTFELIGKGRALADAKACELVAVIGAVNVASNIEKLTAIGADKVIYCADKRLRENTDEIYTEYLALLIEKYRPEIFLYGATKFGRSLAPRIAARVKTGLTADCTVLEIDEETALLRQTRPAFGGNIMATIICPNHRPQMATVRPGVMPAPVPDAGRKSKIIEEKLPSRIAVKTTLLGAVKTGKSMSIADAEVLIVAGRGIGNQKNLGLVRKLVELMGAELGCSRPLVDMGWCEYRHQVGQTGCTVAPRLLISVGVSGAIQHLAGITRAEKIVAINSDPEAPIFGAAHYSVIGDAVDILKEMIEAVK